MFKVGDIITGTNQHNGYGITNSDGLMLVVKTYDNGNMDAYIICHNGYHLRSNYTVENSRRCFKYESMENFLVKYPDCYRLTQEEIDRVCREYSIEIVEREIEPVKPIVPYELSDEMRKELIEEMRKLLVTYHYDPMEEGLNKIIDVWCREKGDLIRLFEKHPNYNGRFQIVFSHDFNRDIDIAAIEQFGAWLISDEIKGKYMKEVQIGELPYNEAYELYQKAYRVFYLFTEYDWIENINGLSKEESLKEKERIKTMLDAYHDNPDVSCHYGKAFDKKLWEIKEKLEMISEFTDNSHCQRQFADHYAERFFERRFPELKAKEGQKISRIINKALTNLGLNSEPDYNREFAKFADAVNPLKVKRHTVISIHPIDFYTMSFGNSWTSCHTIDKRDDRDLSHLYDGYQGCYSSGTESYMLDKTSCVFYTVKAEYEGNKFELQDKINRNMFHYYDNQLVQGRVYPKCNDDDSNGLYKDIREIVQKVFADMLEAGICTHGRRTSMCRPSFHCKFSHFLRSCF